MQSTRTTGGVAAIILGAGLLLPVTTAQAVQDSGHSGMQQSEQRWRPTGTWVGKMYGGDKVRVKLWRRDGKLRGIEINRSAITGEIDCRASLRQVRKLDNGWRLRSRTADSVCSSPRITIRRAPINRLSYKWMASGLRSVLHRPR